MKTSINGIAFLQGNESLSLTIKRDNKGPMIGYSHDLTPAEIESGMYSNGITRAGASSLLAFDLATRFEPAVNRLAPQANQNQFDALIDFCYNLGPGALATMLHHGFDKVPVSMVAWCYEEINGVEQKSPGLLARRQKEVALFLS